MGALIDGLIHWSLERRVLVLVATFVLLVVVGTAPCARRSTCFPISLRPPSQSSPTLTGWRLRRSRAS